MLKEVLESDLGSLSSGRPCPARRRSWSSSGERSTSTTSSASSRIRSGKVSRTRTPVSSKIASFRLSRCWTLTVEMTSIPAIENLLDVLVALVVAHRGGVRMGELVDQGELRLARDDGVDVHLVELECAVGGTEPWHGLEAFGAARPSRAGREARGSRSRRRGPALGPAVPPEACDRSCRPPPPFRPGSGNDRAPSSTLVRAHAPKRLWTTRSISLMPTNGRITPPSP